MVSTTGIRHVGSNLVAYRDNGTQRFFVPTPGGLFLPTANPDDNTDVGDDGGDGTSADDNTDPNPGSTDPGEPDPITSSGIDLYNPWKGIPFSGTWEDHMSYSAGGIDLPLAYGTPLKAPANGTLHVSGGSGEYAAGQIGSAGRRSILYLDKSFPRKKPRGTRESNGPMVAIVFQHQSRFGKAKHYNRGDILGYSGASANGNDYGGEIHLHIHGLDRDGARVNFFNYF